VRETSLDFLSTCLLVMEYFYATLCSNLGNQNSDASHMFAWAAFGPRPTGSPPKV